MDQSSSAKAPFLEAKSDDIFTGLLGLIRKRGTVFFWKKGEKTKIECAIINLDESKREFSLKNKNNIDKFIDQDLCFHFQSIGPQIFGQGILKSGKSFDQVNFVLGDKIFRLEKRQNFRLPVYPQFKCLCHLNVQEFKNAQDSRHVPSQETTQLLDISHFKDFLDLTADPDHEYFYGVRFQGFRIQDMSIHGLSFVVNEKDFSLFEIEQIFEKYRLVVDNTEWIIEKGRVAYVRKIGLATHVNERKYKIGMQHLKMDSKSESGIGRFINDSLRSGEFNQVYENWMGIK